MKANLFKLTIICLIISNSLSAQKKDSPEMAARIQRITDAKNKLIKDVPYKMFDPACCSTDGKYPKATAEDLNWLREARFGIMVHWNPSCVKPCQISWAMRHQGVDTDEYFNLYKQFNPVKFNPKEWIELFKDAGAKYLVFTTKHHDGFAMFDTKMNDYKVTNSPYGKDVFARIADECHKQKFKLGAYYSPADWHHPAARSANWDEYVNFMKGQLNELMTNYGTIDILFFDYWQPCVDGHNWEEFYKNLRILQPHYLHNRNTPWAVGDYEDYENNYGPFNYDGKIDTTYPNQWSRMHLSDFWETLVSVENTWSFQGDVCKPSKECIIKLVSNAGHDGNLLLNFTPGPAGEFPPKQIDCMKEIGAWLKINGEAIYGTRGGPYKPVYSYRKDINENTAPEVIGGYFYAGKVPKIVSTFKENKVFVHILEWQEPGLITLPKLPGKIIKCYLITGEKLKITESKNSITIHVPKEKLNSIDNIIILEINGLVKNINPIEIKMI